MSIKMINNKTCLTLTGFSALNDAIRHIIFGLRGEARQNS